MGEEQFLMILPSNSSMRYFPENTTTSFITELPHTVHLHGEWEVALSEIQFPCSFLHVRHGENVLKFVDIKHGDENGEGPFIAKEITIPNGVYKDIEELISAINAGCKSAESHLYFEQQNAAGGKIAVRLTCENADSNCRLTHYINFSNTLLRIFGLEGNVIAQDTTLKIRESNSNVHNTLSFIKVGFLHTPEMRVVSFGSKDPYSLWRGIPDKLFVYCDVCASYITGDARTPLLRIVPVSVAGNNYSYGTNLVKHFSPPHYIPLQKTNFRRIEIDIRDQLGKRIPFESGTLTVTLHFRRVQ